MTKPFRLFLVAAVGLLLVTAANAQIREVEITGGRVSGVVTGGIAAFKGIPFAAPPVGDLRWKPPQPVNRWTAVKAATTLAHLS